MLDPEADRRPVWAVAMAASAGGIPALDTVLSELPGNLPAVIFVVQHLERSRPSQLAEVLSRHSALKVIQAVGGARAKTGHVYVAPPDHHLSVGRGGRITLTQTPLVHFVRPSADVLFAAVATEFGDHAIAVILTGSGSDGADGAALIGKAGGTVVAQDEETSQHFSMPRAVIEQGSADYVVPLNRISSLLMELTAR